MCDCGGAVGRRQRDDKEVTTTPPPVMHRQHENGEKERMAHGPSNVLRFIHLRRRSLSSQQFSGERADVLQGHVLTSRFKGDVE